MDKYMIMILKRDDVCRCNRRFLYRRENEIYDVSIDYFPSEMSADSQNSIQKHNKAKIENKQMLSEVLKIAKDIGGDSREIPYILNVNLLNPIECNDGNGNLVNALGIDIDDEYFSILYVLSICEKHSNLGEFDSDLFEEEMIEEGCFVGDGIELCSVCDTPHLVENMVEIESDSSLLACPYCEDGGRIVRCCCIHHANDNYYIRREDVAYEDEDGNSYCEAYNDNGGLTSFEDSDELDDFYYDLLDD